ncbi:hypothetical protein HK107_12990 [Parvularcula sp. ZS-1/3]|uniref:Uncharacterized protein n=1 Tax=Parvularcula mediterranea TaxID=2732508 RepID=A0A7Y3W5Y5_9PROT|nr:hypothetical protein [Parvularcula mediterranea]NNU17240.1 hypothetical protein [Parvularcula mediterranea]
MSMIATAAANAASKNASFIAAANTGKQVAEIASRAGLQAEGATSIYRAGRGYGQSLGRVSSEISETRRLLESGGFASRLVATTSEAAKAAAADLEALNSFVESAKNSARGGYVLTGSMDAPAAFAEKVAEAEQVLRKGKATYQAEGGFVLVDAEQYSAISNNRSGLNFAANEQNDMLVAVQEGRSTRLQNADDVREKSGRVDYRINFEEAGTYSVFVRGTASVKGDTDSNSVHLGFNGEIFTGKGGVTMDAGELSWGTSDTHNGNRVTFEVKEAGVQTISMFVRETGTAVDALLFTKDADYDPKTDSNLAVSEIRNEGEIRGMSLEAFEALVNEERARLDAVIAEGTTTETAATEANPYLQAVLDAQQRGAEVLKDVAEKRADRFSASRLTSFSAVQQNALLGGIAETSGAAEAGYSRIATLFGDLGFASLR